MFKIFIFLFIFVNAYSLELNYTDKKFENFQVSYIVDYNSSLSIEQVRSMQFKSINNKHAFNGKTGYVWYKINLTNTTKLEQEIFIHNMFAYYHEEIVFFEFLKNKMTHYNRYDIITEATTNPLIGKNLVHEVKVPADAELTVYIRNKPMVSNLVDMRVYNQTNSIKALMNDNIYSIVIVSIMIALAFYNASLYFFNKRREFLYYAIYMINPAMGLTYKYGIVFDTFYLYGRDIYWLNLTAIMLSGFLMLFLKQTLVTKNMDKMIDRLLNSVFILIAINVLLAIIIDLTFAIEVFKFVFFYTFCVMVYLGYYLFKTSHPLANIFIIAYSFYMSGMIITILAMSGLIELTFFTFHSGGIGLILEGVMFSYLMHYNVKNLEKEIVEQRKVIISKNKKAQLGDMISAITHQWKQPISRITSITTLLEFKIAQDEKIEIPKLGKDIAKINSNAIMLSETIDDFKDFFNPQHAIELCDIEEVIHRVISISEDDTMMKGIVINTDLKFTEEIQINRNELFHILLNIVQNSKEAFNTSKNTSKLIKIFGYQKDTKTYIDIIDNAGGISEEQLPFIFDEYYTTKEKKEGSGLGLYLTKIILQEHLQGSIEVKNVSGGAMFRIIL